MQPDHPTICLNMIVRNEAHVVREALDTVSAFIAYWVIVDTGSIDETRDVIRAYFLARGIPGELHDRPWRDFGHNRTEALALARGKADYIWVIDADDLVVGTVDLSALTSDCYHLRFGTDFVYWRAQMFRGTLEWAYRGVIHEYPVGVPPYTQDRLEGDYYVESRRLGDRNRAADKYQRDCQLLLTQLSAAPDDPRTIFYLGQSCFDAGDAAEALRWYTRRADLGGWAEEVYYALFRRGACLERLNEPWPLCQDAYLSAWEFRPTRAEPLVTIAEHHRLAGRPHEAYLFARAATEVAFPEHDSLFVTSSVYRWRSVDERSIAAYYTGRFRESLELCATLLDNPHLPEAERDRVMANRDFAVGRVLEEPTPYPDAVVRQIVERQRVAHAPPLVTLTMTSCKRRHLFAKTVDSFLDCCADLQNIGRWIVADDGSTDEDRAWMVDRYPFFEWIWKTPGEKGHARSMNRLLDEVGSPYWLHLEDDWQFFVRDRYVTKALAILDDDASLGQVLFNRNYGETVEDRGIAGGLVARTRRESVRYRIHQHADPGSPEYADLVGQLQRDARTAIYWPHYSLRPSLTRVSAIRDVGRYDPHAAHFELEFAARYSDKGYRSAFFDSIQCRHLGRLTSARGPEAGANAYDLNNEPQFGVCFDLRPRRVKLLGPGAEQGRRQARAGGVWKDMVLVGPEEDADYVAILGSPGDQPFEPSRTIVFPSVTAAANADAPDTVAGVDRRALIQVRTPDRYGPVGLWRLDRDWETLASHPIEKTRGLSAVLSAPPGSQGDRVGRTLVEALIARACAVSVHGPGDAEGLLPYAYTVAIEDESRPDHVTDALWDALVAECLCFYWGCPNLERHVDSQAFVRLPVDDLEASVRIIADALRDDLRAARLAVIRREKHRLLHERQLVPTLARLIRGHECAEQLPVRVLNLDRRPDRWQSFRARARNVGRDFLGRCQRVPAVDGRALTLTPEIVHTFRGNDFHHRRGIVGCALSHLAMWAAIADAGSTSLVLEDDVVFDPDFLGRLTDVCGWLLERHAEFGIVLLGYQAWTEEQRAVLATPGPVELRPMDWSGYLGGCFGYLLSPAGARTLLARAEAEGVQNGIDWFIMRQAAHLQALQVIPQLVMSALASPHDAVDSDIQHDFDSVMAAPGPSERTAAVRIKLMGNWCSPEQLCREWNPMSQGNYRWHDIEVTWEDRDIDFYVIVNWPPPGERFVPARTIVFQMEPWCALPSQTWGAKTWGAWARPDPAAFLQVRAHSHYLNNATWQFASTYHELKTRPIEKTRLLSAICSAKYFDPGHVARVDFLRYLESRHDPLVPIDIFGYDNGLRFESYRGPLAPGGKEAGLAPYRYAIAAENNREHNYISEKLWESLLTETLCFYAGCPNAADHVDPRAFIALDLSDKERAFAVVRHAVLTNEFEQRIDAIRHEKQRVLEHHQFFPTLERVIQHEFKMPAHPTDEQVVYHKYFHALVGRTARTVGFVYGTFGAHTPWLRRFLQVAADVGLAGRLDALFVVNVGEEIDTRDVSPASSGSVHVINYSPDATTHERAALDLVQRLAREHLECRLLYVGAGDAGDDRSTRLIEGHRRCLAALDDHDVVSCGGPEANLAGRTNGWWANGHHVARLPTPSESGGAASTSWVLTGRDVRSLSI